MRTKETETLTIRTTITTTVKLVKETETKESTTMPVIIIVLNRKGS